MSPNRIDVIHMQRPGIDGDITEAEAGQLRYDTAQALAEANALSGEVAALSAINDAVQEQLTEIAAALGETPDADVALPNITGRYLHLDATTISAVDQTRIATWTGETGGLDAVRVNTANQPLYSASEINGRPAVVFDNARDDSMEVTGFGPGLVGTVAMVVTNNDASGNRYLFGTDGTAKNVYWTAADTIGAQSTSTFAAPSIPVTPKIVIAAFGLSGSGVLRIDGAQTTGTVDVPASGPTKAMIGHRTSLAAGQGHDGAIGELIYYNRVLPTGECEALERYLAAKWGIPITPQAFWYVDTVAGDNANTGRSANTAVASLDRAWRGMEARKETNATIYMHAPESDPDYLPTGDGLVKDDGGTVRIVPLVPGDTWHLRGTERVTSGWTDMGGNVYRRALTLSLTSAPIVYIPTMLTTDGNPTTIFTRNTTTPTTPAAGEYGYSGGYHYLHLPDSGNPNNHTIELVVTQYGLWANTGSIIHIDHGHIRGAQNHVVLSGASTAGKEGGYVYATDSIAEFALTGAWSTAGNTEGLRAERCTGRYTGNDGFNHHATAGNAALMELIDCEGAWNADEGVSPHDDTLPVLHRGHFHHNGHGGITSVGNAVTHVFGTEVDHNRETDSTVSGWDSGGVAILEQSRLVSLDLYSHDHPGPGIEIDTAAGAVWVDNGGTRSGIAEGNGAADVT